MDRAFVAVGSNINPPENVRAALRALALHTPIVAISTVYRTEPEGRSGQASFYNCVVEIRTEMRPHELKFRVLRRIEADLGRQRTADKNAPRTIDLDLILYGDLVLNTDDLVLPDPQVAHRPFLAVPLSELAPDLKLPGTTSKMAELAARLPSDKLCPLTAYTGRLRTEIKHAFRTECGKEAIGTVDDVEKRLESAVKSRAPSVSSM
jgi:2-amino-4-hydroxy-6-hydroxymethyldihydropteridine diphosphokinase